MYLNDNINACYLRIWRYEVLEDSTIIAVSLLALILFMIKIKTPFKIVPHLPFLKIVLIFITKKMSANNDTTINAYNAQLIQGAK